MTIKIFTGKIEDHQEIEKAVNDYMEAYGEDLAVRTNVTELRYIATIFPKGVAKKLKEEGKAVPEESVPIPGQPQGSSFFGNNQKTSDNKEDGKLGVLWIDTEKGIISGNFKEGKLDYTAEGMQKLFTEVPSKKDGTIMLEGEIENIPVRIIHNKWKRPNKRDPDLLIFAR